MVTATNNGAARIEAAMLHNRNLSKPNILAVIVLYKCSISQSSTCISMQRQQFYDADSVSVLIYDNSPTGNPRDLPQSWAYVGDPKNSGLPAAYNCGISQAESLGAKWILLLDQDSHLPGNFLASLLAEVEFLRGSPQIAAIVPLVVSNHKQISPVRPLLGLDRPYSLTRTAPSMWLAAINSAAAIKVSFVQSIGGFSQVFWLDYLDHWLFRIIYDSGNLVFVSDMVVKHHLSVADFNHSLDVGRYRNVLAAEADFTNACLPFYWRLILVLRLMGRAVKHSVATHDKRMALLMLSAAGRQMLAIFSRTHVSATGGPAISDKSGRRSRP